MRYLNLHTNDGTKPIILGQGNYVLSVTNQQDDAKTTPYLLTIVGHYAKHV